MFHPNSPSNKGMVNALPLILKLLLRIDYWGTAEDALSVSAICHHALQDENILVLVVLHNKKTFYTYD